MGKPLRVLFVEDSEHDAETIARELRRGGFEPTYERVDTQSSFQAALEWKTWDVIIADYTLPRFNGLMALGIARETGLDIPFILVPGAIGEGLAVTVMKAGAQDYVLKDQLARLPAVVEREVREARVRRRKREAEQALERSHRAFRQVIDSAPDGVGVMRDGKLLYANGALAECLGFASAAELVAMDPVELLHPADRDAARAHLQTVRNAKNGETGQFRAIRRDGRASALEISTAYVDDFEGAPALVLFVRDVTERIELQTRMIMAERIIAAARLATGAALELSNPLAALALNTEFIEQELDKLAPKLSEGALDDLRGALVEARESAERMRATVMDLRLIARADAGHAESVDLSRVVEPAINLSSIEVRKVAKVAADVADAPAVRAQAAGLLQVIIQLVLDAAEGMDPAQRERNAIEIAARERDDGRVSVEVSDNGPTPSVEAMARIFDPEPLTATPGVVGRSLAVVKKMVEAMEGEIVAEPRPTGGMLVRVILPAAERPSVSRARVVADTPRSDARPRILVVDDEPMVTWSVRRVLGKEWDVVVAHSGEEALARIAAPDTSFDAVLCDVIMPGLTGMDVHAKIRERSPELAERVIFLTGGAFTPEVQRFLGGVANPKLDKPVQIEELRAHVVRMLQASTRR
jgi:PAS domain S-box-containing protein